MSKGNHDDTPPENIFRRPENLRKHYYPRRRTMPYKSPVVAWTSERVSYYNDSTKEQVEGIRLQPLDKRFTVNAFTGELISTKKDQK